MLAIERGFVLLLDLAVSAPESPVPVVAESPCPPPLWDSGGPVAPPIPNLAYSGNMDMALALRTVAIRDGTVIMQAGGGIVYDSTADFEYQETLNKMGAGLRAIEVAEEIERGARRAGARA